MKYIVTYKEHNERIDKALSLLDNNLSRSFIAKLLKDGKVLVNGKIEKASFKVKENDEIYLEDIVDTKADIKEEDIPAEVLEREEKIAANKAREEGKPEAIIPKIVEGSLKKFKTDVVLMNQPYIRDESITIADLINQNIVSLRENIVVRRFVRYALGDSAAEEE